MIIELINTGSELMLGSILNTHQQWICQQFARLGNPVARQVAVPDTGDAIAGAVREGLSRSDVVMVTGGLGPTSDDLTRELVAEMLGRRLREEPKILEHIQSFFSARNRPMPERTRIQAQVPEGATVLPNAHGTAPGLVMEIPSGQFREAGQTAILMMLPGPPRELRPMFSTSVVPLLRDRLPGAGQYNCRILRSTGIGESIVEQKIAGELEPLIAGGLEVGYCARPGAVDIRLVFRGASAGAKVDEAERIVRATIGKSIFGTENDDLEGVVVRLLAERKKTLSLAESCTGGLISHRLTNVPGSSRVFVSGLVTYANAAKQRFLGVRDETLKTNGAVSEETAREMAEGARDRNGTTYGLAVTGIAGPSGGSADKPVGTVFIALARANPTIVLRQMNPYNRETFKQVTSQQALEVLRRDLMRG